MSGHQVTLSSVLWFGRIHKEGCALECEDTNLSNVSLYFSFPTFMYTISSAPLNLLSLMSTPTISVAPAFLAAWITDRPSAPRPKTATDFWGSIFVVLKTAPHPVETPQPFLWKWKVLNKILNQLNYQLKSFLPKRHILFKSAPGWILAADISAMTAYSANVEHP